MIQAPASPRRNDPEGVRRRILDAAFAGFVAEGWAATPMQALQRAAGVSGGAFAHHFATKKALTLAVLRERAADAVAQAWLAPLAGARDAPEGVAAAFHGVLAGLGPRIRGCPLNNLAMELSPLDPDLRAEAAAIFAGWRAALAAKIRADQAAGRLAGLEAEETAALVVAAYSGAMAMARAGQDPDPIRRCAAGLARMFAAAG